MPTLESRQTTPYFALDAGPIRIIGIDTGVGGPHVGASFVQVDLLLGERAVGMEPRMEPSRRKDPHSRASPSSSRRAVYGAGGGKQNVDA